LIVNSNADASTAPFVRRLAGSNRNASSVRVAVVGAGPAGLYAVESLLEAAPDFCIDVFDRLPTPYGLVRYGVAPDNQKMKSVTRVLRNSFNNEALVRFIGNVCFGVDVRRTDLLKFYDAVIYATGAPAERRLGMPGEDLPGSYGAKEFIEWYNGHPDAAHDNFLLDKQHAAVIGAGNVALDVARMLVRGSEEIASTDVPDRVLAAFRNNRITDVHLIARRGPAQAKFTPVELRGLGDLLNADIVVRPEEMLLSDNDEISIGANRELRSNIARLREWAEKPLQGKQRRLHIRFLRSPVRILGEKHVEGIMLEGNEQLPDGHLRGTGNFETLKVDMIFRAVGYRSLQLPDMPFDEVKSIIPNNQGRVLSENGQVTDKEYVTGWAKRGPSGTIGTNRSDSAETVCALLADIAAGKVCNGSDPEQISIFLDNRRVNYTNWMNWLQLDDYETQLGRKQGRPRVKIPDLRSMLELSRNS
jgi:ferredoxin/flavodoxin---NADP+ reductase